MVVLLTMKGFPSIGRILLVSKTTRVVIRGREGGILQPVNPLLPDAIIIFPLKGSSDFAGA